MCGVFGYVGKSNAAAEIVLAGLRQLEYRGYDSWGVAVSSSNSGENHRLVIKKLAGKIGLAGVTELPSSHLGLGHTRWATHGGVTSVNSHPHLDCQAQIAVVHNGIIENYVTLKAKLVAAGHKFVSETDSEVVAHLVETELDSGKDFSEAVRRSFLKLAGQNAVVVINNSPTKNADLAEKIVAVRSGSPLVLGLGKDEAFVASDSSALLTHTREVYFLADEELAEITSTGFQIRSVKTGELREFQTQQLKINHDSVKLGKFKHFLQKEIHQQPKVLQKLVKFESNKTKTFSKFLELIKAADQVWLVGCGSASFAAMAGVELLAKLTSKQVIAVTASEFSSKLNLLNPKSLVVGISQSGETMDVLNALKAAKNKGATLAGLVNAVGSSLERLVITAVMLEVGPELAVATTKAFTSKLGHFIRVATELSGDVEFGKNLIVSAATAVAKILQPKTYGQIQKLALSLQTEEHIFILGKGTGVAAAAEFALKLKETAYIHAEGLAAGELKHGSLALIEIGTPCVILMTEVEHNQALLSAAMELKARGGRVIGIGPKPQSEFSGFIQTKDCGLANLIPQVVVGQILGYELALLKGIDPDKPRNLAKSVTVI